MPSAKKVFSGTTADATAPIPFDVTLTNGKGEKRTVELEAYGEGPADALLMVGRMQRVTKKGKETVDFGELRDFYSIALLDDSAKAFEAMLDDREWMMKGSMLGDIFSWLQEQWLDDTRPTEPSPG